jgi:hypothetical protein
MQVIIPFALGVKASVCTSVTLVLFPSTSSSVQVTVVLGKFGSNLFAHEYDIFLLGTIYLQNLSFHPVVFLAVFEKLELHESVRFGLLQLGLIREPMRQLFFIRQCPEHDFQLGVDG